jgi:hypothetical protein
MRFASTFAASLALIAANFVLYVPPAAAASCVQTKITKTEWYFANTPGSGYVVIFASNLGVSSFKNDRAKIVDRYSAAGSTISKARAGDVVKLCLTQVPVAGNGCNPSKDDRGRMYSAYDARLKAQFTGANDDHACGGA